MTRRGAIELVTLLTDVDDMILPQDTFDSDANKILDDEIKNSNNNTKKIFTRKPTVCGDDFFFDGKVQD